jgi:hypothetical protein
MNRPFFYVALIAAITCLVGCQEKNKGPVVPIDGIKLSDLSPANSTKLPPQIFFRMFVFEMPAENFTSLRDIFESLSTEPLRFVNEDTFKANGFEAAFGYNKMWDGIGSRLRELNARKVTTKNIFIFDDDGYDIPIGSADNRQTMLYIAKDRTITTTDLASGGQFTWRIKAHVIKQRRATAGITIMPVFKHKGQGRFAKMVEEAPSGETVFGSAAFGLNMSDEDFVLIGPSRYNRGQITLCNSFFVRTGDYIISEPSQYQADGVTMNKPVTVKKEIPTIRLYMIVCVRVDN